MKNLSGCNFFYLTNGDLSDSEWIQASLPDKDGASESAEGCL